MTPQIEKREERIIFILAALEKSGELKRRELFVRWIKAGFPEGSFNNTFGWLKKRGSLKKKEPTDHFSPFEITDAGRQYLSGLRA